jgi:hypothetical protein
MAPMPYTTVRKFLCPACSDEYLAWLTAPPIHEEQRAHSLADKPREMLTLNHDRYRKRINRQLQLIVDACKRDHAPHITEYAGAQYPTPALDLDAKEDDGEA